MARGHHCREFEEALGTFITPNPDFDDAFHPAEGPMNYVPPERGRQYALTNGKTYMPIVSCPFCGHSLCRPPAITRLAWVVRDK